MSFRPFSEPGDGAQYERFADDARYSIHITDPNTGATQPALRLRRSRRSMPATRTANTVLSYGLGTEVGPILAVGDARQNFTQTYHGRASQRAARTRAIGSGLLTPPPNVGKNVTPLYNDADGQAVSGRGDASGELDVYTSSTIYGLRSRRGRSGRAIATTASSPTFRASSTCWTPASWTTTAASPTVSARTATASMASRDSTCCPIAMQIPVSELEQLGIPEPATTTVFFGTQTGVGVYASVSRPRITVRKSDGSARVARGGWVAGVAARQSALHRGAGRVRGQGSVQPHAGDAGRASSRSTRAIRSSRR